MSTLFSCDRCYATIPLEEINETRNQAAQDAQGEVGEEVTITPITSADKVECAKCDAGVMSVLSESEEPVMPDPEMAPELGDVPPEEEEVKDASAMIIPPAPMEIAEQQLSEDAASTEGSLLQNLGLNYANMKRYSEFQG